MRSFRTAALLSARRWCASSTGATFRTDYFTLFGLTRGVDVDTNALKKAYHSFQAEHHPDIVSQASGTAQAHSDAAAYAATAFSVLKDPFQRCRYLKLLAEVDEGAVCGAAAWPTATDYYRAVVGHDTTERAATGGATVSDASSPSERDRRENPVNHNEEFLAEMMALNMELAEAQDLEGAARAEELRRLQDKTNTLAETYYEECRALYLRVEEQVAAAKAKDAAADRERFTTFHTMFREKVLMWTYINNLKRQIHEAL